MEILRRVFFYIILASTAPLWARSAQSWVQSGGGAALAEQQKRYSLLLTGAFDKDQEASPLPISADDLRANSVFNPKPAKDALWSLLLNKNLLAGKNPRLKAFTLLTLANVDYLLLADNETKSVALFEKRNGKAPRLAETSYDKLAEPQALLHWLYRSFGFDGIVLAQSGSELLVHAAAEAYTEEGLQGLVLSNSAQVKSAKALKEPAAVLVLKERWKGYGVFQILQPDGLQIEVGSKVRFAK